MSISIIVTSTPIGETSAGAATTVGAATGRRVLTNAGALAASSLWRIVTSFALMLMISRRLGVEGFGYYAIALSYLNVCQVFSEAGLPALLTRQLAQMPQHRRSYFWHGLLLQGGLALLTWALLALAVWLLPLDATSRTVLWLVGATLPFYACTSVCQMLFQAGERMEYVLGVELAINTLILSVSLAVLWLQGDVTHLVAVLIATQALSALLCIGLAFHSRLLSGQQERIPLNLPQLWRQAAPFYGLSLADVLLQRLDTLLLSFVGGVTITGIYSLSDNLVRVLIKLMQSAWRALYPTLSRLSHQMQTQYRTLTQLSIRYGIIVLLPIALLGTLFARQLLGTIYEEAYAVHALVFQIAIWAALAYFFELFAVTALMVENRPLSSLWITLAHILVILLLLPVLVGKFQATGAALAVTLAGACGAGLGLWFSARHRLMPSRRSLIGVVFAAVAGTIAAWASPVLWLGQLVIGGSVYLGGLWFSKAITIEDLRRFQQALRRPA